MTAQLIDGTAIAATIRGEIKAEVEEMQAKHTTKEKAEKQKRLLNAVEHGWKPRKK